MINCDEGKMSFVMFIVPLNNYQIIGTVNVEKVANTFLFLLSNMLLVIRAGVHEMLVRIANRKVPDQTASSDCSEFALFV